MTFIDFISDPSTLEAAKSTAWCGLAIVLVSAAAMAMAACWRSV